MSHGSPLDSVAGEFLREGEAAIAGPTGDGGFRLLARVEPRAWAALDKAPR